MAKFQDDGGTWWHDTPGALELLQINHRQIINKAVQEGTLPHVELCGGRCMIFREADLLAWAATRKPRGRPKLS
jgi:hypothetical protein